jgi:hypothetical protein
MGGQVTFDLIEHGGSVALKAQGRSVVLLGPCRIDETEPASISRLTWYTLVQW